MSKYKQKGSKKLLELLLTKNSEQSSYHNKDPQG